MDIGFGDSDSESGGKGVQWVTFAALSCLCKVDPPILSSRRSYH
jgi:hypothetical protein